MTLTTLANRRRSAALPTSIAVAAMVLALTGCSAPSEQEETSVLPDTPITDLLPTGAQYTDFNGGVSWGATTSLVPEDLYGRLSLGGVDVSAVDYGESCANAMKAGGAVDATIKEAATQEIGINSADEFATLIRYATVEQAKSVFDAQVEMLTECSKNEGTAVFTPIDVNVENTLAYNSRTPHTDDDFIGFGRRGDLLVVVTNTNDDATEVGPTTIRYIMNNLADKAAGSSSE